MMVVCQVHQKMCYHCPLMFLSAELQFIVIVSLGPWIYMEMQYKQNLPVTCPVITTEFGYTGKKSWAKHSYKDFTA